MNSFPDLCVVICHFGFLGKESNWICKFAFKYFTQFNFQCSVGLVFFEMDLLICFQGIESICI